MDSVWVELACPAEAVVEPVEVAVEVAVEEVELLDDELELDELLLELPIVPVPELEPALPDDPLPPGADPPPEGAGVSLTPPVH